MKYYFIIYERGLFMKSKKSDTVFKNYLKTKLCEEILILWNSNYTENISDVCLQSR